LQEKILFLNNNKICYTYRTSKRLWQPELFLVLGGWSMDLNVGEIVKLKKQHPCGSSEWEILRVGMDFRLKCLGCGHQVMIPRKQVEKNIKQVRKP
jgi:hypothetical protein